MVHLGAALSDAGKEDITPHGVECVGDVDLDQHISGIRITAGLDEASCTVDGGFTAEGRSYPELGGAELGPEGGRQVTGTDAGCQSSINTTNSDWPQSAALLFLGRTAMRRRRRPLLQFGTLPDSTRFVSAVKDLRRRRPHSAASLEISWRR